MAKLEESGYTIITEHKIGDEFWLMSDNRPTRHIITGINLEVTDDGSNCKVRELYSIAYERRGGGWSNSCSRVCSDKTIYKTKEELIASL